MRADCLILIKLYRVMRVFSYFFCLSYFCFPHIASSDAGSARLAMDNNANPLVLLSTSLGDIYIELLPDEAPNNVMNFLALAHGEIEFTEKTSGKTFYPRYFDGMQFHRVIPGTLIQTGSPHYNPLGMPRKFIQDEINADLLGLDQQLVMNDAGELNPLLNIHDKNSFQRELLDQLLDYLKITAEFEIAERQYEIYELIADLTLKQAYEIKGYRYTSDLKTRRITRSIVALANNGPDSNGPEFFIATSDLPWLNGKHTVIGKVVEGMSAVDAIGKTEIDPLDPSRFATLIYSLRRVD